MTVSPSVLVRLHRREPPQGPQCKDAEHPCPARLLRSGRGAGSERTRSADPGPAQRATAAGGHRGAWARGDPRRCRHGQDHHHHPPHRAPGRDRRVPGHRAAGGHLHREGGPRAARQAARARRRRGRGADVPRRGPVAAAPAAPQVRGSRGPADRGLEGAADRLARQRAASAAPVHAAQGAGRRDRMGEEPHGLPGRVSGRAAAHGPRARRSPPSSWRASSAATNDASNERSGIDFEDMLGMAVRALPRLGPGSRGSCATGSRPSPSTSTRT